MCGVMLGSTWSPESMVPSVGSYRQRWSAVWPGVCTATHSLRASRIGSASARRTLGWGVPISFGNLATL